MLNEKIYFDIDHNIISKEYSVDRFFSIDKNI